MSLRENVTKNNFHSVGVSGPLQNVNRLGCHIFSESYDQQLSDFDFKSVFLWTVPGFTYLLRFVSLFMEQRWKTSLHGTDLYEHNTIKVDMTFWCTVVESTTLTFFILVLYLWTPCGDIPNHTLVVNRKQGHGHYAGNWKALLLKFNFQFSIKKLGK